MRFILPPPAWGGDQVGVGSCECGAGGIGAVSKVVIL